MISVSGKKWIEQKVNKNSVERIKQDFNFDDILAKISSKLKSCLILSTEFLFTFCSIHFLPETDIIH